MAGYWNRILEVNLGTGEITTSDISENLFRDFIGGGGVGSKLFYDRLDVSLDPLAPENPFIVMTGPLTCSNIPGAMARFSVVARSPLTGLSCEASCGGTFGHFFKKCGYDGIVVTGAADSPVYLEIIDDRIEIKDASALWGKDTYQTTDVLVKAAEEAGAKKPSVLTIGQAGENLVKYANVMNGPSNYAGRGGIGAVMGSKKLKAIVARGSRKVEFADAEKLKEMRKVLTENILGNIAGQTMKAFGTAGSVDLASMTGDLPMKNWSLGSWDEGIANINGLTMTDNLLSDTDACLGCPVGCKRIVKIEEGAFAIGVNAGPEYETVGAFGSMMLIPDLKAISKLNDMCNRYGMDTISCGGTISFMIDLMENGVISAEEAGGLNFKWGDPAPVIEAVSLIAKREGIGDLLAEGSREVCRRLGKGEDYLAEVKGMEVPMHDPRAYWGMGLNYAVGNRGACHVNSWELMNELGFSFLPEVGLGDTVLQYETGDKAQVNILNQALGGIVNSTCVCHFPAIPFTIDDHVNMVNCATGLNFTNESLMEAGDRMWLLKRGMNNMLGATRGDDRLPKKILTPLEDGATAGMEIKLDEMIADFYRLRDIDESGKPSKEVLEKAGLDDLAKKLHG